MVSRCACADVTRLTPSTSTTTIADAEQLEMAMRQSVYASASSAPTARCGVEAPSRDHAKKLEASIKAEMAVFESTGKRGRNLQQVYQYLLTVPPTSVEAERAFSAAGVLCTKLRNRLQDKTLDTLCFLRAHYTYK